MSLFLSNDPTKIILLFISVTLLFLTLYRIFSSRSKEYPDSILEKRLSLLEKRYQIDLKKLTEKQHFFEQKLEEITKKEERGQK